ncbi:diguanylate cyclase/phosphodiesterase [Vibrio sp. JCM 19052]|nr:diguanylate cyclase/phosphodiesterase [Vibrio sp. JCM 19052]
MYSLLSSCEVVPFYQPIVDVNNNKIEGVEALIRLKDKKGNLIFPSEFIDYAENNEIIIPMTQRMIEKSFDDLSFLLEGNGDFYVSVNIVARHLENSDLYNYLKGLNIPLKNLSLELTERQVIKDWEVAIETVSNLKTLGLSFSLDDAGTGFGGNSYLQYLDFDSVKIDKVFVDSIRLGDTGVLDSYILMLKN